MHFGLVKVAALMEDVRFNIVYAKEDNFTGRAVYPANASIYLLRNTVLRLQKVQNSLKRQGMGLMIFDGYRPLSVQKKFWDLVPDPRYVSDPAIGSVHNRGAAVDLTLVDSQGNEMAMPSGFDDFSKRAHREFNDCEPLFLHNRKILEEEMTKQGFLGAATEWWHFDDPEWERYPLLDISFEELESM